MAIMGPRNLLGSRVDSNNDKNDNNNNNNRMGSKTRGSCQACANVKVRCSKERPTCSRCEDRGLVCEYLQSRRPGRVPGSGARSSNPDRPRNRRRNSAGEGSSRRSPARVPSDPALPSVIERTEPGLLPSPALSAHDLDSRSWSDPFGSQSKRTCQDRLQHNQHQSRSQNHHQYQNQDQDQAQIATANSLSPSPSRALDYGFGSADTSGALAMDMNMSLGLNNMNSKDMDVDADVDIDWEKLVAQTDFSHIDMMSANVFSGNDFLSEAADRAVNMLGIDDQLSGKGAISPHPVCATAAPTSSVGLMSPQVLPSAPMLSSSCSSSSSSAVGVMTHRMDLSKAGTSINSGTLQETSSPCQCMLQALDLVKTLAENPMSSFDAAATNNNAFAHRIISLNRQAIETAMAIMVCTLCTDERFVLMALLMATTKILGRYALAAALCGAQFSTDIESQSSSSVPTPNSSYLSHEFRSGSDCFDRLIEISRALSGDTLSLHPGAETVQLGWCPRREDVQRVLQELHGVQRLLTHLSTRLQHLPAVHTSLKTSDGFFDHQHVQLPERTYSDGYRPKNPVRWSSTPSSTPLATPLPPDMLHQMEENLRRNLYMFSAAMRDVLKNS